MPINNFLGETYLLAGDFGASQRAFERGMAMDPNFPLPHAYIAGLFEVTRKYETAMVPCVPGIPETSENVPGRFVPGWWLWVPLGGPYTLSIHSIPNVQSKCGDLLPSGRCADGHGGL